MYGKWLKMAVALACAGSAEAQGLVGYAGPPVRVYERPAPPCGPDCIINTLADAVIRVAPLFVKPRCCAQPPTQAAAPPATNGSAASPAPPNQADALDELPTTPLVPGGITRMDIQALSSTGAGAGMPMSRFASS